MLLWLEERRLDKHAYACSGIGKFLKYLWAGVAHILGLNQSPDLGSGRNFALGHIGRDYCVVFVFLALQCGLWLAS